MSNDLLQTARYLIERPEGSSPADLRRAISTTYYALFQTLAKLAADLFVGAESPDRTERAWQHIYRSIEHTRIADKCSKQKIERFTPAIRDFADLFLYLQHQRQLSDYEYGFVPPGPGEISTDIERAELKIRDLLGENEKHLRAFCVYIMIDKHRHEEERKYLAGKKPIEDGQRSARNQSSSSSA